MPITSGPKPPVAKPPKKPRVLTTGVSTRNKNLSAHGIRLLEKLERLRNESTAPGTFSLSFMEVGKTKWLSSLVGVKAVDKLEHGIEGGRKMKAVLMVRVTGRGIKRTVSGQPTKRVPAKGVRPVTVDSLKDIETFLREGTKQAKAVWAAKKKD